MRHRVAHRKLGRTTPHRIALLRNLATALFERERIRTTLPKAKELRPFAERLITLARREDDRLHARRLAARDIHDRKVVRKLFDTIGPRFATRPGGYTRIMRLGPRPGDGAEMAILELVGYEFKADGKGHDDKGKKAAEKKEPPKAKEKKPAKSTEKKAEKAAKKEPATKKRPAAKKKAKKTD
ncbi:MAG: 50S ribosomal protein L17 [Acidobacteria bacterium]|jgi:large subunit ribosomal protein L17|nr:50S ribosomal protein L17 [Acidobacteriota bacterium]